MKKDTYTDYKGQKHGKITVLEMGKTPKQADGKRMRRYWKCKCECGMLLEIRQDSIPNQHSCGCDKTSKGERAIQEILTANGYNYNTQQKFVECKDKRELPFDVSVTDEKGNTLYIIEYDGRQHVEPIKLFGGIETFKKTQEHDKIKNEYCKRQEIPLIRIPHTIAPSKITVEMLQPIENNPFLII